MATEPFLGIATVVVVVPMVPGPHLSPNARTHWGSRQKDARLLREAAKRAVFETLSGAEREWLFFGYTARSIIPKLKYDVEIVWPKGRKRHDDDNAWTMIKPARDGVAEAAHINDSTFMTGTMTQVRAGKDKPGQVILTFSRYDPNG